MSVEPEYKRREFWPTETDPDVPSEGPDDERCVQSRRPTVSEKGRSHSSETENKRLKLNRTKALLLASRVENALRDNSSSSNEELRQTVGALIDRVLNTEEALQTALLEHDAEIREVKRSLRNEYARGLEVLRQRYESELSHRSEEIEQRLRAECKDKLASAKTSWKAETDAPLTKSTPVVPSSMLDAPSKWEKRTRLWFDNMGWIKRARDGMRHAYAIRERLLKHRQAIKSGTRPWKDRGVLLKRKFRSQT